MERDSLMKIGKAKLIYCVIGIVLITWMNIELFIPDSEAPIGIGILAIIIAFPISLVAQLFGSVLSFIYPYNLPYSSIVTSNILLCFILLMGHLQWFNIIPWLAKKFTDTQS